MKGILIEMKLFKKNFKYFIKLYHISIPVLLVVGWFIYDLLRIFSLFDIDRDAFHQLTSTQGNSFILFIVFLYAAYEYMYCFKKSAVEETVRSYKGGISKSIFSMLCVLEIFILFPFALNIGINIAAAAMGGITDISYYIHILLVSFLNIFILCTVAGLMGFCLAGKFKRIAAYTIMVVLVFIMSPAIDMMLAMVSDKSHINFWNVKRFFSMILPQNTTWIPDYQYGVSNEIFRYNISFFWIFSFLAYILYTVLPKRQKKSIAALAVCLVLAVFNLAGYFGGGSCFKLDMGCDSIARYDYEYYRKAEKKEVKADFTVESYDMDLSLWRDLSAEVTMKLNNPEKLTEYIFTLYRDFKISDIKDENGNSLSFTQQGDYLTVSSDEPVSSITVKYKGHSNIFFSNVQAAALPGCFPYYPMTGFHILSDSAVDEETGQLSGVSGYLPISNGYKAQYDIRVNSIKSVYSNIPEVSGSKNTFSGKVQYPTLMSGFIEKCSEGGYTYYGLTLANDLFKITPENLDNLQQEIDKLEKEKGIKNHLDLSGMTVFATSNTFRWASYSVFGVVLDDQIFISYVDENSAKNSAKYLVKEYNKNA